MIKVVLLATLALSASVASAAPLVTLRTGPVNAQKPVQANLDSDRIIKCLAQNFTTKPVLVKSATIDAGGIVLQSSTTTLAPATTAVLHQVVGGLGYRYCSFTVGNRNLIRGWLEIADDDSTSLIIEAR